MKNTSTWTYITEKLVCQGLCSTVSWGSNFVARLLVTALLKIQRNWIDCKVIESNEWGYSLKQLERKLPGDSGNSRKYTISCGFTLIRKLFWKINSVRCELKKAQWPPGLDRSNSQGCTFMYSCFALFVRTFILKYLYLLSKKCFTCIPHSW